MKLMNTEDGQTGNGGFSGIWVSEDIDITGYGGVEDRTLVEYEFTLPMEAQKIKQLWFRASPLEDGKIEPDPVSLDFNQPRVTSIPHYIPTILDSKQRINTPYTDVSINTCYFMDTPYAKFKEGTKQAIGTYRKLSDTGTIYYVYLIGATPTSIKLLFDIDSSLNKLFYIKCKFVILY